MLVFRFCEDNPETLNMAIMVHILVVIGGRKRVRIGFEIYIGRWARVGVWERRCTLNGKGEKKEVAHGQLSLLLNFANNLPFISNREFLNEFLWGWVKECWAPERGRSCYVQIEAKRKGTFCCQRLVWLFMPLLFSFNMGDVEKFRT